MTMKMNVCIIDDEFEAQRVLISHIDRNFPDFKVVAVASSYEEGVKAIQETKPDLIFLDINLSGHSGLDLARQVDQSKSKIIFTTAYDEYAIDAIRLKAFDYLLKPIFREDFVDCIQRLLQEPSEDTSRSQDSAVSLINNDGVHQIERSNILYIEAGGAYCTFYLKEGKKIIVSKPLKSYCDLLGEEGVFFRVHKSFLVNRAHIERYSTADAFVYMKNGVKLPVARPKRSLLKKSMEQQF